MKKPYLNAAARLNTPLGWIVSLTIIFIVTSFSTNIGTAFIVIAISSWAIMYSTVFNRDLFASLLLGYVTYFLINTLTYVAALLLNIDVNQILLLSVHIVTSILILLLVLTRESTALRHPEISPATTLGIGTFVVTFAMILIPFLNTGGLTSLKYLSIGEDNISHYALHNSILKNKSFLYSVKDYEAGVNHNLKPYPQGFHANLAATTTILFGDDANASETIKSHILQISALYALLVGAIIYIITASFFIFNKFSIAKYILITSVSILVLYFYGFGLLLYQFTYGFHTQVASCILLLTLAVSTLPTIRRRALVSIDSNWLMAASLMIVTILTSYVWYFMLPVVAIFGIAWFIYSWRFIVSNRIFASATIIATAILSAIPVAYDTFRPHDSSSILLPGAVWPASPIVQATVALMIGLFIISFTTIRKHDTSPYGRYLLVILLSCLVFAALIAAYMLFKINKLEYYFYKAEYTLILIAITTLGYTLGVMVSQSRTSLSKLSQITITSLLLAFSLALCISQPATTYSRQYVEAKLSSPLFMPYVDIASSNKNDLFLIKPVCRSLQNYLTQRWMQAVALNESREQTSMILNHIYYNGSSSTQEYERRTQQPNIHGLSSISCDP